MSDALTLLLVAACAPTAILAGAVRPRWAPVAGGSLALVSAAALLLHGIREPGPLLDVSWLPSLGTRFTLGLDALATTYAVLTAGIGALVVFYAAAYLPRHLEHEQRPARDGPAFHATMLAFLAAMVLLVTARDLIVIFVALDLTALASYFLIRFDHEKPEARQAALLALLITAGSSLLFLVGALLLGVGAGTTSLDGLAATVTAGPATTAAAACIAAGVLAKSAQFPLHFWLPRAMLAPTPVSAYLHSAAMVAAGVFVLQRLHFILALAPAVLTALFWVGLASILAGSVLALVSDPLKRILAWSTVAQYGYVVLLVSFTNAHSAAAGPLYVVVHALCKSALFMTAGSVTMLTGAAKLSGSGGLARQYPMLAAAAGVAAAGLAGLPLTAGYFKDELFFAAAWEHGHAAGLLAAAAAALTLAYTARFWTGIFTGKPAQRATSGYAPASRGLVLPIAVLAGLVLLGGVLARPLTELARAAGLAVRGEPVSVELAYHFEARPETLLALAAWTAGSLLFLSRHVWQPVLRTASIRLSNLFGPERWARAAAALTARLSDRLHAIEIRDMRDRAGAIIVPMALLMVVGLLQSPGLTVLRVGTISMADLPLLLGLLVAALAAVLAARQTGHLALILQFSFVGFGIALIFAFSAAPDVALVSVLIETTFTLLFLLLLVQVSPALLNRARQTAHRSRRRDLVLSVMGGVIGGVVAWSALSRELGPSIAPRYVELAEHAHAGDIVTALLTDFRGLDTAVEISVLAVAIVGVAVVKWERER